MSTQVHRKKYDDLPIHPQAGRRSAWGTWGNDQDPDHLGSLNNLTAEAKISAAQEVRQGISFQLDWTLGRFGKPAFGRSDFVHKVINYQPITGEMAHDDEVSFNTQISSQWDGFMHYADQDIGCYYNGLKHTDDVASTSAAHGIHSWCEKGIVGRGVLLDWPRWLAETGQEVLSPAASHAISVGDLQAIAAHQGLAFKAGDVLIIRTGFGRWLEESSESERDTVFSALSFSGVKQGEDTQRWLWDTGFSAVAADSVSWECYPPPKDGSMLHQWLLPHAGIPIGELLNLESLAEACSKYKQWSFLFTSAPLNVQGGIASPPNAIALL